MGRHEHKHRSRRDEDDEKHREHRRKRDRYSSNSSEEERKRKKKKRSRRYEDDYDDSSVERKSSKRRERKSDERKRERKERRRHDERKVDKKSKKKSRDDYHGSSKKINKSLYPMGEPLGHAPDSLLDPIKDYFTFHEHFWAYLYRNEGVAFNDLTSEQAREAFERFAKAYNKGKLEAEYYDAKLPEPVLEECKTTKHSWSFNKSLTDRERKGLQSLQHGIRKQTEYNDSNNKTTSLATTDESFQPLSGPSKTQMPPPPSRDTRKTPEERLEERRANKRLREHVKSVREELQGGPKDFRERQIEKKREQSDKIHGASREKHDAMELSDNALYGGDSSHLQAALERERSQKARTREERAGRIAELQNKEKDRQENMLKMLGLQNLKPGQKITIAPRKD